MPQIILELLTPTGPDPGPRGEMEDPFDASQGGFYGRGIDHIALKEGQVRVAFMLGEVGAASDGKIVEHVHAPPVGDQPVDQMAADEASTTGDKVDTRKAGQVDSIPN